MIECNRAVTHCELNHIMVDLQMFLKEEIAESVKTHVTALDNSAVGKVNEIIERVNELTSAIQEDVQVLQEDAH